MWCVNYHDGSQVPEFDDTRPEGRGFLEVDSTQVKILELDTPDAFGKHRVAIPDGAEPVFFRRRRIEMSSTTNEQTNSTVHCIGWKQGDSACYLFVCDDGSTLLTNDLQAV